LAFVAIVAFWWRSPLVNGFRHMTMVASAACWEPLVQGGFRRSGRKDINLILESGNNSN
jgi:hypothetical protein